MTEDELLEANANQCVKIAEDFSALASKRTLENPGLSGNTVLTQSMIAWMSNFEFRLRRLED